MFPPDLVVRLDPWPADYDAAVQIDATEPDDVAIDAGVEIAEADWRPVAPGAAVVPPRVCFVDGVRRVDARILAEKGEQLVHGLFGSLATGCVEMKEGRATLPRLDAARFLILGEGLHEGSRIGDLVFEPITTQQNTPQAVFFELQNRMRDNEARLADELAGGGACVFIDGPLTYFTSTRQNTVGIIKTIIRPYLKPKEFRMLAKLAPGERTPLFCILDGQFHRYSCFLRLARPRPVDHSYAGLVRLEMASVIGLENARCLANLAANELPRLASTSARDPRAPQNLLPVGALEQQLRHRMGDPLLIRRTIEKELHRGVTA